MTTVIMATSDCVVARHDDGTVVASFRGQSSEKLLPGTLARALADRVEHLTALLKQRPASNRVRLVDHIAVAAGEPWKAAQAVWDAMAAAGRNQTDAPVSASQSSSDRVVFNLPEVPLVFTSKHPSHVAFRTDKEFPARHSDGVSYSYLPCVRGFAIELVNRNKLQP